MYEKQKERLQFVLSSIGTHPPHIVDTNWKMDYVLKVRNCQFLICFQNIFWSLNN